MRVEIVRLDAIEVVLGLRVDHAEDRVRVGLAVDVRDAPVVAHDRDVLRLALPRGELRGRRLLRGGGNDESRNGGGDQNEYASSWRS